MKDMFHSLTLLTIIRMKVLLDTSPNLILCPINISTKMKPVRYNNWFTQSFLYSCFKGWTHTHDYDLYLRSMFLKVPFNRFFIPIWKNVNWFSCDSISYT